TFRAMFTRTYTLPPTLGNPTAVTLTGTYKRLQVNQGSLAGSVYNGSAMLRYADGARTMIVVGTMGYLSSLANLTMPDLTTAPGWSDSFGMPLASHGTWTLTVDGTNDLHPCADAKTTAQHVVLGTF